MVQKDIYDKVSTQLLLLFVDGEVKVGILACPVLNKAGTLFSAIRHQGVYSQSIFNNGDSSDQLPEKKIQTVSNDDISNFRFVESVEASHGDQEKQNQIAKLLGIKTSSIQIDSQAKYGLVANGDACLYLRLPNPNMPNYRECIWDHAAGAIIVEEAGGCVTDMNGKQLNFQDNKKMINNSGVVVSSNESVHQQVLKVLKEY